MMLCIGIALSLTVFFNIESIEIVGSERYAKGELIDTAGIEIGDNLFRTSGKEVAKRLIDAYPYIAQVRMQRVLPDSVLLHITEAQPKTALEGNQGYLLLDERARILESDILTCPEGYSRVLGFSTDGLLAGSYLPEADMDKLKLLLELEDSIKSNELSNIDVIDVTDPINIWLLYDGRVAIEMGGRMDLDYKVRAAKSVIDLSVTSDTVGMLDVSTRPVMRLRERNIYEKRVWPFPEDLISDYERVVIKKKWQLQTEDSTEENASSENSKSEDSNPVTQ